MTSLLTIPDCASTLRCPRMQESPRYAWFYHALQPGVHYLPFNHTVPNYNSTTDLLDVSGLCALWEALHDLLVSEISMTGPHAPGPVAAVLIKFVHTHAQICLIECSLRCNLRCWSRCQVIKWLREHDSQARQIAANALQFAVTHLTRWSRLCYWKHLLEVGCFS